MARGCQEIDAVAHYVEGHRPRGLTGIHEQPGPGSIGNPPESSEVCAIPSGRMHGAYRDEAGSRIGDFAEGFRRNAVAVGWHGAHLVATLPQQEPREIVRAEFVLGDHDVFAALSGRQVRGDYSGGGAHGRDDRDLLMMRSDDLRENGSGVFPCPFRFGPVKSTG